MKFFTHFTGQLELYDLVNDANEAINLLQSFSSTASQYNGDVGLYDRAMRKWFSFYEDCCLWVDIGSNWKSERCSSWMHLDTLTQHEIVPTVSVYVHMYKCICMCWVKGESEQV